MNALKPRKTFVQDELNIERLTPVQWDGIMRAMDKYAKHYYETMQANEFEKPQEQCVLPVVVFSEAEPCKYYPCSYNGKKDCSYPYCLKYTKGEAEVCQHENTYEKERFCTTIVRCKDCDSFWQT